MTPEKDAELCKKYPMLFSQRTADIKESCMGFGIECGDGWYDLIDELSAKLEAINEALPRKERIEAAQLKEKFGTLRFYTGPVPNSVSEEVFKLIEEAEHKSAKICEGCGKPGKSIVKNGWVSTLCAKCRK